MLIEIKEIIKKALAEDIQDGDITTKACIPDNLKGKAEFLIKAEGILSGIDIAGEVFKTLDPELNFNILIENGTKVKYGDIAASVSGKASSILIAERTALNFLQRMSGIASTANLYQSEIKHTKAKIIDTRKTVPGLRILDKMAVKAGGCSNHRIGLFDMFLIKDNHIAVAGSITNAINKCKEYRKNNNLKFKIEVETENLNDVNEALLCKPDIIMLDNFETEEMAKAVKLINSQCLIEASGGITIDNVKEVAETGVDLISIGALTHSVKGLDISLEITL